MAEAEEFRCFIGGLSWNTTDRGLETAFQPYGNIIEAKVVFDKQLNRSRGFGFVTFETGEDMDTAIRKMHEKELDGRIITVSRAEPKAAGGGGGGGGGGRDRDGGRDRGGGGPGASGECFNCGGKGHWARDCPNAGGGGGGRYRGRDRERDRDRGDRNRERERDRGSDRYERYSSDSRGGGGRYSSGGDKYNSRDAARGSRSGPYDRPGNGGGAGAGAGGGGGGRYTNGSGGDRY